MTRQCLDRHCNSGQAGAGLDKARESPVWGLCAFHYGPEGTPSVANRDTLLTAGFAYPWYASRVREDATPSSSHPPGGWWPFPYPCHCVPSLAVVCKRLPMCGRPLGPAPGRGFLR